MITQQVKKRGLAIAGAILFLFVAPPACIFLSDMSATPKGQIPPHIGIAMLASSVLGLFFWFKAHIHWAKAKGYSGWLGLLAILGFPIAPIVFACLKDLAPEPPPINDPLRQCPSCGTNYRHGEYNPDAEKIFCSVCKTELPKT